VKAAFLCLAHALLIAIAGVNSNPNYASYRHGKCMKKPVEDLLMVSGVVYPVTEVLKNLNSFKSTFLTLKLFCLMDYTQLG